MRIAIIVQRYGVEVNGGAELEARLVAEHLAPYLQVEVLTTCARDYMTWQNEYPAGVETINGIPVRRFPVRAPRQVAQFDQFTAKILAAPATWYDQVEWMARQGPDVPALFEFLRAQHHRYDLLIFYTYLYATTFIGLQIAPQKSILVPTAHDEPWIYFDLFRTVFHLPRGLIFNSPEEQVLVRRLFHNEYIPGAVLGVGIEVSPGASQRLLDADYILYMGRVDRSKNCDELFRYFIEYKRVTHDPIKLVLLGSLMMPVPAHPDIVALGYVSDAERFTWLQHAQAFVMPSQNESLSMATLEAWAMGVPVLVNGAAIVLKGHCQRSGGGLYYNGEDEFATCLQQLLHDKETHRTFGQRGKNYIAQFYRWERIEYDYITFLRQIYKQIYSNTLGSI